MGLEHEYGMPPKSTFPNDMPRFANLWVYVSRELADTYGSAVRLIINTLADTCGLIDDFTRYSAEAADAKARVQNLMPYTGFEAPEFNHDHDLHIRYYYSELQRRGLAEHTLAHNSAALPVYQIAASIHFEVAQKHPYHPYIDPCPICGRTGEYHIPGDQCQVVHDPLGLELLLNGTVRGTPAHNTGGKPFVPITILKNRYKLTCRMADAEREDANTLRIGCVVVEPL